MHAEHIGTRRHVCGRGRDLDSDHVELALEPQLGRFGFGQRAILAVEASTPHHDVQSEPRGTADHFTPDIADSQQPERAAVHAARLRVLPLVPHPGAQLGDVVGNAAIEREQQAERELRDGDGVLARTVRHVDTARGGGGHVDRVVAGAGAHDQAEMACIEHRRGDLRAAHDQDVRFARPDRIQQRIVLQVGPVDHVAVDRAEPFEAAGFEVVGDENFHSSGQTTRRRSDQVDEQAVP